MTAFITVTVAVDMDTVDKGTKVLVNPRYIVTVFPCDGGGVSLSFPDGRDDLHVAESLADIEAQASRPSPFAPRTP